MIYAKKQKQQIWGSQDTCDHTNRIAGGKSKLSHQIGNQDQNTACKEAASMLLRPLPEIRAAMGPERKATEAMGPVTEAAKAVSTRASRIRRSLVILTGIPRVTA